MSRYIDADALKKSIDECDICNVCPERKVRCSYDCDFPDFLSPKFEALIDAQPTIEPKRGEWVKRTHDTLIAQVNFAYCSECGQPIMHEHTRSLWNFCPNCGADMREREGE